MWTSGDDLITNLTSIFENVKNFQALAPTFQHTACHGCCIQLEIGSRGEIASVHTF